MRQATLDVATTRAPASRREGSGIEGSDAEDILAGNRGNDAVTINDLPSEVLLRIIAFVDSPWVLVQAQRASSRLFGGASPAALAAVWGADRLHRLIHADAPLAVIEAAMDQRTRPLFRRLIVIAARHGRVDVMRLTSNRIQSAGVDMDDRVHDDVILERKRYRTYDEDEEENDGGDGQSHHSYDIVQKAVYKAAKHGHVDALRFLTTRSPFGANPTNFARDGHALGLAARHGHLGVVVYIHDRMAQTGAWPCPCTESLAAEVWRADESRVAVWLRDYGCRGYQAPRVDDLCSMISEGRLAVLRYALDEHPPPPLTSMEASDRALLDAAVATAAGAGYLGTLRAVVAAGLCATPCPLLVGAADGNSFAVMEWVLAEPPDACLASLPPLTRRDARSAVAAASSAGRKRAVRYLVDRFGPEIVDPAIVWSALANGNMGVIRLLDGLLSARPVPFPWAAMLTPILEWHDVKMVRYIVENKGVAITPGHIGAAARLGDPVADYLCARCSRADLQAAMDIAGARSAVHGAAVVRALRARVPDLCASVAVAVAIDTSLCAGPRENMIDSCDCPRCASGADVVPIRATTVMRDGAPSGGGKRALDVRDNDDAGGVVPKRRRHDGDPPIGHGDDDDDDDNDGNNGIMTASPPRQGL